MSSSDRMAGSEDRDGRPDSATVQSLDMDAVGGVEGRHSAIPPSPAVYTRTKRLAAAVGLIPSADKATIESLRAQLADSQAETQRVRGEVTRLKTECEARIEELLRQQALEIRGRQLQLRLALQQAKDEASAEREGALQGVMLQVADSHAVQLRQQQERADAAAARMKADYEEVIASLKRQHAYALEASESAQASQLNGLRAEHAASMDALTADHEQFVKDLCANHARALDGAAADKDAAVVAVQAACDQTIAAAQAKAQADVQAVRKACVGETASAVGVVEARYKGMIDGLVASHERAMEEAAAAHEAALADAMAVTVAQAAQHARDLGALRAECEQYTAVAVKAVTDKGRAQYEALHASVGGATTALKAIIVDLTGKVGELEVQHGADLGSLKEEHAGEMARAREDAQAQLSALQRELEGTTSALTAMQQRSDEGAAAANDRWEAKLADLHAELVLMAEARDVAVADAVAAAGRARELEVQLDAATEQLLAARAAQDKLEHDLASARGHTVEALLQASQDRDAALADLRAMADGEVQAVRDTCATEVEVLKSAHRTALMDVESKLAEAREELAAARIDIDTLRASFEEELSGVRSSSELEVQRVRDAAAADVAVCVAVAADRERVWADERAEAEAGHESTVRQLTERLSLAQCELDALRSGLTETAHHRNTNDEQNDDLRRQLAQLQAEQELLVASHAGELQSMRAGHAAVVQQLEERVALAVEEEESRRLADVPRVIRPLDVESPVSVGVWSDEPCVPLPELVAVQDALHQVRYDASADLMAQEVRHSTAVQELHARLAVADQEVAAVKAGVDQRVITEVDTALAQQAGVWRAARLTSLAELVLHTTSTCVEAVDAEVTRDATQTTEALAAERALEDIETRLIELQAAHAELLADLSRRHAAEVAEAVDQAKQETTATLTADLSERQAAFVAEHASTLSATHARHAQELSDLHAELADVRSQLVAAVVGSLVDAAVSDAVTQTELRTALAHARAQLHEQASAHASAVAALKQEHEDKLATVTSESTERAKVAVLRALGEAADKHAVELARLQQALADQRAEFVEARVSDVDAVRSALTTHYANTLRDACAMCVSGVQATVAEQESVLGGVYAAVEVMAGRLVVADKRIRACLRTNLSLRGRVMTMQAALNDAQAAAASSHRLEILSKSALDAERRAVGAALRECLVDPHQHPQAPEDPAKPLNGAVLRGLADKLKRKVRTLEAQANNTSAHVKVEIAAAVRAAVEADQAANAQRLSEELEAQEKVWTERLVAEQSTSERALASLDSRLQAQLRRVEAQAASDVAAARAQAEAEGRRRLHEAVAPLWAQIRSLKGSAGDSEDQDDDVTGHRAEAWRNLKAFASAAGSFGGHLSSAVGSTVEPPPPAPKSGRSKSPMNPLLTRTSPSITTTPTPGTLSRSTTPGSTSSSNHRASRVTIAGGTPSRKRVTVVSPSRESKLGDVVVDLHTDEYAQGEGVDVPAMVRSRSGLPGSSRALTPSKFPILSGNPMPAFGSSSKRPL